MTSVRVERLIGTVVRDADGRKIGRIEEIRAERRQDGCFVTEYHVGSMAVLERLSAPRWIRRIAGAPPGGRHRFRVAWDEMDLSDPKRPRVRG